MHEYSADYCLAAHTLLGKKTGLTAERILGARRGLDSDAQIVDIVLAMTAITLTNLFNRVNDTAVDFPPAD